MLFEFLWNRIPCYIKLIILYVLDKILAEKYRNICNIYVFISEKVN